MYYIFAVLIFSVLIAVHELGHFAAAKLCGVQVNEFSIFMGPKLLQWKGKETAYTLRCIPFGGYCAMEGEDENSENPRAFTRAKTWKRALILVAGAAMNYIAGLIVIFFLYFSATAFVAPTVASFFENCPYESEQGLQAGDTFYSIDGMRVHSYSDVSLLLDRNPSKVYDLVLLRNGEKVVLKDYTLKPVTYVIDGAETQKIGFYFGYEEATLGTKLKFTWNQGLYFTRLVWLSLGDLVRGEVGVKDMSGPVGIVSVIAEAGASADTVREGILDVLFYFSFIAINLAVMNLLPIPALDGGRVFCLLLTALIEAVTRKKLDPKYEGWIHAVGMVLLLGFMAFVTLQDIWKVF